MKNSKLLNFLPNVEIAGVQLMSSNFSVNLPPEILTPEDVSFGFENKFDFIVGNSEQGVAQLFCFIETILTPQINEGSKDVSTLKEQLKMTVKCKYVVRYIVKGSVEDLDENLLNEFAKNFSIAHAYPYIRNHVDSQFREMGLISLALPLYKSAQRSMNKQTEKLDEMKG